MPAEANPHLVRAPNGRPTIGFLLASLHTGATRELWPGLLDAAERHDVNLISFPGGRLRVATAFENQRNQIFELPSLKCLDGLVTWASSLGGVLSPSETRAFHSRYQGLPMVSLAQFMEGLPAVALDSYHGMRALLTHLIQEHGYTRLAFVRGPEEHYYAQERYRAYLDTLEAHHLPLVPDLVTRPLRWESGAEAVQILLDERGLKPGRDFHAVVAVSDMLAVWALKTLQARGYEVPGQVAVTGFNNSIEERLTTPPLTTVDLPFYDQGARSVDLLLAQMAGETVPALMTLPSSLIVRQSCGCPSAAVQQAAYLPQPEAQASGWLEHRPGGPSMRAAYRAESLAELRSAAGVSADSGTALLGAILDGLLADLRDLSPEKPGSSIFLHRLGEALNQAMLARQDLNQWNDVISILRRRIAPCLEQQACLFLEALFGQARVMVSEANQKSYSYWHWQVERQAEALRETNRALLTTFDIHQLGDVLFERLPLLGIPSAYLVLYEKPTGTAESPRPEYSRPEYSRLVMAYSDQERAALDPAGWRFPTEQVLPAEFLPHQRRYSLVVEPLYFQEKSLGYAVFESGPRDGEIFELIRANLSSAIQGALLFDEIQQARLTAEKADRIKTRLLANVSHELRTPLNIILEHTQALLETGPVEPAVRSEIKSIQDHAGHQLRVINDLLDLSRAEIDELDLSLELIDPLPLLQEAFQAIAEQGTHPGLEWRLELPERLPLIRADVVRLRQILLNLLSNARKFTQAGRVSLGAEVVLPYIHFWVSDTGWGISPEQQERIFEPFVTMEHDQRIAGGIGLGLSITRHLVALHGGKMTLDSQVGKGSTFHFYIPLPALDQDQGRSENAQPVLLLLSAAGQPAAEIQSICRHQALKICYVSTIDELETVLASTRPLAVAWDLAGAHASDWLLVRRLRRHPLVSQAPFILYGQRGDPEAQALDLGLTSFLVKTPNRQSVIEMIEALCPASSGGTILIVDDDPEVRLMLQALVTQGLPGYAVRLAEDGESALACMQQETPALVLLDLVMPGLSGADVLDQMRTDPHLRQTPVVILSSKSLSLEDVRRLEKHARVVLQTKGVWTEEETLQVLNRALFGTEALPAHTSALVKRAVAYLHQNYSRPLARWEIAEAIGVSEDYLTRVFNRELGISPWDYLNRYRILRSQALLRTSDQSIGAIARAVGFKDQAYFSRVFSKQNGVSPQEYRDA